MAKSFPNTGATVGLAADRTAMTSMLEGQEFFETDTNKMFVYSGSGWVQTNSWSTTSGVTSVSNLIVPPTCRVQLSSNQTFTNAAWAALSWGTAAWDTDSMFTAATNYVQINTAGLYQISYAASFANNSTGARITFLTLNTATIDGTGGVSGAAPQPSTATDTRATGSLILNLAASDRLRVLTWQNSGGNLTTVNAGTENYLSVVWVGRTS